MTRSRKIGAAAAASAALLSAGSYALLSATGGEASCGPNPTWPTSAPVAWQGSLDASISVASPGDVVRVPPGTYPGQTVKAAPAGCVFVDATGATFGSIEMQGAQHIAWRGMTLTGLWNIRPSTGNSWTPTSRAPADLTFSGFTAKTFLLRNSSDVTFRDGTFCCWDASVTPLGPPKIGAYIASQGASQTLSTDTLIDNVTFRDMTRTVTGTAHAECFYLDAGTDGVVIRNSTFTNCAVFDVFSNGDTADRPIDDILIEGNLLDVPRDTGGRAAASAIDFKGGATNVTIRGNSILGNIRVDADGAPYPGWLSEDNAIGGSGGSSADVMAADPGFVSASKGPCDLGACFRNDLRVVADSVAGRAGAGVPVAGPPPPPPPPTTTEPPPTTTEPPPCPGTSLSLRRVSEDASTVTFGWTPPQGVEDYVFYADEERVSWTDNGAQDTVRFAKGAACYRVDARGTVASGGSAG